MVSFSKVSPPKLSMYSSELLMEITKLCKFCSSYSCALCLAEYVFARLWSESQFGQDDIVERCEMSLAKTGNI